MKYKMKNKTKILVKLLSMLISLNAQDITTVQSTNIDISDNLDLKAVASLFGETRI